MYTRQALLTTALRVGGMAANATEAQLEALTDFGYNLGLAFQVIDDILDLTASTEKLGKKMCIRDRVYPNPLHFSQSRPPKMRNGSSDSENTG